MSKAVLFGLAVACLSGVQATEARSAYTCSVDEGSGIVTCVATTGADMPFEFDLKTDVPLGASMQFKSDLKCGSEDYRVALERFRAGTVEGYRASLERFRQRTEEIRKEKKMSLYGPLKSTYSDLFSFYNTGMDSYEKALDGYRSCSGTSNPRVVDLMIQIHARNFAATPSKTENTGSTAYPARKAKADGESASVP